VTTLANDALVNREAFARARAELGANFVRILGYFREDGVRSVAAIEEAMQAGSATAMVIPAHTLKGEARQFGADPLAELAEIIEMIARDCLESREAPTATFEHIVKLRDTFEATLALLQREASPLVERRLGFGRRLS